MKRKNLFALSALFIFTPVLFLSSCQATPVETPPNIEIEGGMSEPTPPFVAPPVNQQPEPEPKPEVKTISYIRVKTDGLNVRKGATTSSAVLGQVEKDVSLLYVGKENGFYKTYYKNGTAYISASSSYTETYESPMSKEKIENVIQEGCKFIGTTYVYGAVRYHDGSGRKLSGFTTTKFDCSSLMQYIFYTGAGVLLNTTTRTQVTQGRAVKKADIQRGDLLFFTNSSRYNNTGIERVGHIALYLGDNLILHTASDYCKIEEISAQRWKYYLQARRMI